MILFGLLLTSQKRIGAPPGSANWRGQWTYRVGARLMSLLMFKRLILNCCVAAFTYSHVYISIVRTLNYQKIWIWVLNHQYFQFRHKGLNPIVALHCQNKFQLREYMEFVSVVWQLKVLQTNRFVSSHFNSQQFYFQIFFVANSQHGIHLYHSCLDFPQHIESTLTVSTPW